MQAVAALQHITVEQVAQAVVAVVEMLEHQLAHHLLLDNMEL
jgi:hypothetical protein